MFAHLAAPPLPALSLSRRAASACTQSCAAFPLCRGRHTHGHACTCSHGSPAGLERHPELVRAATKLRQQRAALVGSTLLVTPVYALSARRAAGSSSSSSGAPLRQLTAACARRGCRSLAHSDGTEPPKKMSDEDRKWFFDAMAVRRLHGRSCPRRSRQPYGDGSSRVCGHAALAAQLWRSMGHVCTTPAAQHGRV